MNAQRPSQGTALNDLWALLGVQGGQAPGVLLWHLKGSLHVVEHSPVAAGICGEWSSLQGSDPQGSKH